MCCKKEKGDQVDDRFVRSVLEKAVDEEDAEDTEDVEDAEDAEDEEDGNDEFSH